MSPEQLKHLDYIQETIKRIATNQFQIKSWMVTVNAGILTVFASTLSGDHEANKYLLLVSVFPTFIFWLLDSRYLSVERRLRALYSDVSSGKRDIRLFQFPLETYRTRKSRLFNCLFSFSTGSLYLPILIAFIAAYCLLP